MFETELTPEEELKRLIGIQTQKAQAAAQPPHAPAVPGGGLASPGPVAVPGGASAVPVGPSMPNATATRQAGDEAELARLKSTGSGVEQLQHKHPILGTIARIGDAALGSLFPRVAMNVPGTTAHHQVLEARSQGAVAQDVGEQEKEAQAAESQARAGAVPSTIAHTQADTDALLHPQAKVGATPDDQVIHDLMTGDNGKPRVNPKTGMPYSYLDAYTTVKQAAQDVKPEVTAKPDSPEQQFIDEYQRTHKGATVGQAVAAYAAATQKPERAGAGNARSDKSYTYNNDKIDKLGKPIEDAVARMGRLRETLAQGTPQADALVAPELLTIMAGGAGSGLRMNEAEISRIVGGRSVWESLKANMQRWSTDPNAARSITPDQQKQIHALVDAVNVKLQKKQQSLDQAREKLLDSDDPKEHRRIVTDAHHALTQVDEAAPGAEGEEIEFERGADGKLHQKKK